MKLKAIILFSIIIISSIVLKAQSDSIANDSLTLYIYIGGKPDMTYVKAEKIVANNLGIRTEVFFGDCGGTFDYKAKDFEEKNQPVFERLNEIYGSNWKEEYNGAVQSKRDELYNQ